MPLVLKTGTHTYFSDIVSRAATEACEEFYDTLGGE